MKIATTYNNGEVFQHFGKSEEFKIYNIENKEIISSEVTSCKDSGYDTFAAFLKSKDVSVVICGGIGAGAKTSLTDQNIEFYASVSGNADEQVMNFLSGNLKYNPNTECSSHNHEHGHHHH